MYIYTIFFLNLFLSNHHKIEGFALFLWFLLWYFSFFEPFSLLLQLSVYCYYYYFFFFPLPLLVFFFLRGALFVGNTKSICFCGGSFFFFASPFSFFFFKLHASWRDDNPQTCVLDGDG